MVFDIRQLHEITRSRKELMFCYKDSTVFTTYVESSARTRVEFLNSAVNRMLSACRSVVHHLARFFVDEFSFTPLQVHL